METIMVYVVNGKRFDDPQEALAYERLCEQVDNIIKALTPRSELLEDGCDYYEHDLSVVKDCFRKFCILCSKVIPSYKEWFLQTANGDRHISHIGRILSDYSHEYPILNKTLFRFDCISFENGYEFQQPYYVTHQEEFFKDMEKQTMETKFNFNSQICTSREQSERLLALGLKKETADMHWEDDAYFDDYEDWNAYVGSPKHSKHIPAWSLHRLKELYKCVGDISLWNLDDVNYDRLIQCSGLAIKHNSFNKEYLV